MPEQDLNSPARYSKKSNRLILEAHSHCEVPAGCGGAVLRWRNPQDGSPITFRLYAGGSYQFFLDAQPLSAALSIVAPGEHVISLVLWDFNPSQVILLFAAETEDRTADKSYQDQAAARRVHFLSAPDGSWKYATTEPAGTAWQRVGYDDAQWSAMPLREWAVDKDAPNSYRAEELLRRGAKGLGVTGQPSKVWIRRSFVLPPSA